MTLATNRATDRALARIIQDLRTTRLEEGISQVELSAGLPVRARAISEWETGVVEPTLANLILWAQELDRRLVIVDLDGNLLSSPPRPRPGEALEKSERRQLAVPLRNRRQALGMAQDKLGRLVGVSGDSINRWELVRTPPRPIAHVAWAYSLSCFIELRPISGLPQRRAEVVELQRQGHSLRAIAQKLGVSLATVRRDLARSR